MNAKSSELQSTVEERIRAWRIAVEHRAETATSVLAFGARDGCPVVLKVARLAGDEWHSGEVLAAFAGKGVVRILESVHGAVLLERLRPGDSLAGLAIGGDDDRATAILADIMSRMSPGAAPGSCPTVQEWGEALTRHASSDDGPIPRPVLEEARRVHSRMAETQSRPRLLHGDLHHYNVLRDDERGWLAIDPKGVAGEPEYEVGASLRNPYERPDLFTDRSVIERRVHRFASELHLDAGRILAWAFTQAVLAALWAMEDGEPTRLAQAWLELADGIRPMLKGVVEA